MPLYTKLPRTKLEFILHHGLYNKIIGTQITFSSNPRCILKLNFDLLKPCQGYPRPWIAMCHFHAISWNSVITFYKPNITLNMLNSIIKANCKKTFWKKLKMIHTVTVSISGVAVFESDGGIKDQMLQLSLPYTYYLCNIML